MSKLIVVAGATGNLGTRIVKALLERKSEVRVIVRSASLNTDLVNMFRNNGVEIAEVQSWNVEELSKACAGAHCVVSALSGLREVIIDAQKLLLDGAIAAGVKRFIPSDYALDFTRFSHGENRNLDWRREFHQHLDKAPIEATSILNGAFADMLTGQMPLVLFKQKKVLYWGKADHAMTFTTMDNTAAYTANAALEAKTPRYLRIAGDSKSPNEMLEVINKVSGEQYKTFRAGGPGLLSFLIKVARTFSPGKTELYPAWQGMQYMRNMIDDRAKLTSTDNGRYKDIKWTSAEDVLRAHLAGEKW
jgi:NAD(P)-dependent dehydrogenase (short-subunit alcohol dehydrogenase family)